MRNLDDGGFGHDVENDAFNRAHKIIVDAKISGKRNNRTMRQLDASLEDRILPVSATLIPAGAGRQDT
jgi:hypothetical protein